MLFTQKVATKSLNQYQAALPLFIGFFTEPSPSIIDSLESPPQKFSKNLRCNLGILTHAICFIFVQLPTIQFVFIMVQFYTVTRDGVSSLMHGSFPGFQIWKILFSPTQGE